MEWDVSFYNRRLFEEILNLPKGIYAKFGAAIERMVLVGPNLGMPHTRAMGNGLFEIRLDGQEGIGRVFYCALKGQQIIMLHSFVKKTQKTPKHELDIALKRLKEVKSHGKGFYTVAR